MEEKEKPTCPKCGGKSGFIMNEYVCGWWETWYDWGGKIESTNLDKMKHQPFPKSVVCADCKKRIPNPLLEKENAPRLAE